MRPFILFAALFAALLFTAPAHAGCLGNRPVLRAVSAPVRFVAQVRPVRSLVAARPLRSFVAAQPVRRALRGVGSLFVR